MTKTFFIDIDGTIVSNLSEKDLENAISEPELLYGVDHFFKCLDDTDVVIFTTARHECYRELTERMESLILS